MVVVGGVGPLNAKSSSRSALPSVDVDRQSLTSGYREESSRGGLKGKRYRDG